MKKLKIVFSQYDDINNPFYAGGGSRSVHELAKRFTKEFDVNVVTGNYKGAKDEIIDGVLYKRLGFNFVGPKIGQLVYHFLLLFAVKRTKHDVWIESFTPPFSTSLIPFFTKKPVIGLVHMLTGTDMKRKYKLPFDFIERFGLKVYKNFIMMNEVDKRKIQKVNSIANIAVLGNGINLPSKINRAKPQHILYIGRIEVNQKGLDLLLEAYSQYKDKIDFPLVIVGSGSEKSMKKLKRLINYYGLDSRVSLVGRVEGRKKVDLVNKSAFIVVPSRYETFSMVALEAMSYGTPLITFDIAGLRWIPINTRLVVNAFNTDELGRKMVQLSKNYKLRKKLSNNAIAFSKNYSWDDIFQRYLSFTNEVLGDSEQGLEIFMDFMDKSIQEKKKFVFISPHLDDVVFSTGGLISYLSKRKAKMEVINVFTKADSPPYTLSAKRNLRLCGFSDARCLYKERQKEDNVILKKLGVKVQNLGFIEALYRKKNFIKSSFSRLIPETVHLYPTFYFHIVKGVIAKKDKLLQKRIIKKLKKVVSKKSSVVLCPLGNGSHVDHIVTRNACKKVFEEIIYWRDCPYEYRNNIDEFINKNNLKKAIFQIKSDRKMKLLSYYKTQIRTLSEEKMQYLFDKESFYRKVN